MKKLVLILLLLPFFVAAQEVKPEKIKKERRHHSLARGYITANYQTQAYSYNQPNPHTNPDNPHGWAIGAGVKKVNATDPGRIGFRLGLEYSSIFNVGASEQTSVGYLKAGAALTIDKHLNDLFVYHFDAGINFWLSSVYNSYGAPAVGAGIGLRWCLLRAGYEYGLGNALKRENTFDPEAKAHASTFSVGLIFYPTGI
jgi:hypothetical protein